MKILGDKLFNAVQKSQGFAFISDGIHSRTAQKVIAIAKDSLAWAKGTEAILRKFIRDNSTKVRKKAVVQS
jgi:hypothetical protein